MHPTYPRSRSLRGLRHEARGSDLISGNVKRVSYQKGKKDQWSHRYRYDADNRITEVETSADGVHWQRDARYFYYPHGPLERTELGAHVVQGTDYAYTLQGWLKGINGDRLDQRTDMGRDGDPSLSQNANLNVGRDAYALSLGYYGDADYKAVGTAWDDDQPASIAQRPFAPIGTAATTNTISEEHRPLYNGNIAHTVNTLQPFGLWGLTGEGQVLAQVYHYDQLNRLRAARAYTGLDENNTWDGVADAAANRYRSMYEYDANGNITGAARFDGSGNWYDWFAYKYQKNNARLMRNRLYQLNDLADQANTYVNETGGAQDIGWTDDVPFDEEDPDMNTAYNYGYDALGNLVRDDREHIEAIEWTVAGKVKAVDHATGEGPDLAFGYGASGQRIMKQVGQPGIDAGAYREHYIRDAQGNIMATYRYTNPGSISFQLTERPIYGSSRLGSYAKTMQLYNAQAITSNPPPSNIIQRPHLRYELTDHLGNVAAVVTGRLLPSQSLAPFEADLVSAQGYEPFGSLLPGRNYTSGTPYRFGFNGQEKDDEVNGSTGTSYDFGARLYDSRVGRWLSLDPLAAQFPTLSPYNFAFNSPIYMVDFEGKSGRAYKTKIFNDATGRPILRVVSKWHLYGDAALPEVATVVKSDLEVQYNNGGNYFTHTDATGVTYDVIFEFSVDVVNLDGAHQGILALSVEDNYYEVDFEDGGDSFTLSGGVGGNTGMFSDDDIRKYQSTPAHEANHGFGGNGHPKSPIDSKPGECIDISVPSDASHSNGDRIDARDRRVRQETIDAILGRVTFDEKGEGDVGLPRPQKATREPPNFIDLTK